MADRSKLQNYSATCKQATFRNILLAVTLVVGFFGNIWLWLWL